MKLYELTDKGRALLTKPRHKEPTNWEYCCSCCPVLEKEIKGLNEQIETLDYRISRLHNSYTGGRKDAQ